MLYKLSLTLNIDKMSTYFENTKTYKIGKFYDVDNKETTDFNSASIVDIDLHRENMGIHYSVMYILVKMEDGEVILTKEELENLVNKLNS